MNRRVFVIALCCAVLVAGAGWLLVRSSAPRDAGESAAPPPADSPAEPAVSSPAEGRSPAGTRTGGGSAAAVREPARPTQGSLRIVSDVPGAQVFIDRQFIGRAPATAENVAPGTHRLNVEAEGYDGVAQTIEVEPGPSTIEVSLREVRLDAALDAVHKHRFGSCRGRLTATVEGIRYEPDEGEDAFQASLADLETLEVDYAAKNLRVKLRGGRQYDFTHPEGNADRLFVFHRDVDKARTRLAAGDPAARRE